MIYISLVQIYMLFDMTCMINGVDLFVYALKQMIPIFFAIHRPNYARCMVLYHFNPGARDLQARGEFSIRRTSIKFSRCQVDLTLEQTINRDAASRHTGIAAFTDSIKASKRWTITRSTLGAIVGKLLEMAGFSNLEEASQESKSYRMIRDNRDVEEGYHCP